MDKIDDDELHNELNRFLIDRFFDADKVKINKRAAALYFGCSYFWLTKILAKEVNMSDEFLAKLGYKKSAQLYERIKKC